MNCAKVREKLSCYLDGVLDQSTLELIEAHLGACAQCGRELASLRTLVQTAGCIEAVEPPVGLKRGILNAIRRVERKARSCKQVGELLSPYVDGELAPAQDRTVTTHVADCPDCAEELRALQTLVTAAAHVDTVEPPADLRARIAHATTAVGPRKEASGIPIRERTREMFSPRALRWVGGAAAAAVIAFGVLTMTPHAAKQFQQAGVERSRHVAARTSVAPAAPQQPEVAQAAVEKPVPEKTALRRTVVAYAPRVRSVKAGVVAAVTEEEPADGRPVVEPEVRSVDSDIGDVDAYLELGSAIGEELPEPAEVAAAPEPAPVIVADTKKGGHPTLIKVASAPVISQDNIGEWLKRVKAQAAMRRGGSRPGGLRIISAKF